MARTSLTRQGTAFPGVAALTALLMLGALSLGLAGCGNDNPADSGGTIKVDLRSLVDSMNSGSRSTSSVGVTGSAAATAVKSMIIGAVVITFTNTPLTSDTQVTSSLSDKLASDVINSINYFSIVDLPTSADYVEFKVPPPGAGNWQVAAVGTKDQIVTFDTLNDENEAIYYGFDPNFHTTSGSSGPDVSIKMKRACFIDSPPKGCAAYADSDGSPVVTSAVKVWGVFLNGGTVNQLAGGPYDTDAVGVSAVSTALTNAKTSSGAGSGDKLTVVMTHPDAADFDSTNCSAPDPTTYKTNSCFGTASTTFQ